MHQTSTVTHPKLKLEESVNELKKHAQQRYRIRIPLSTRLATNTQQHQISCFQLQYALQTDPMNILVLDCRESCVYQAGHIISAINIPTSTSSSLVTAKALEQSLESYEDRIYFRQREFVNAVVLYSDNMNEEYVLSDVIVHDSNIMLHTVYNALKTEGLAKTILFLSGMCV
jgi:rhodanese-related sulfurtransferase